jgi:hypothetical protein
LAGRRFWERVSITNRKAVMPQTGQSAPQSGIYSNDCHAKQIALSKGETFPPCSHCHRAANWRLVQATR